MKRKRVQFIVQLQMFQIISFFTSLSLKIANNAIKLKAHYDINVYLIRIKVVVFRTFRDINCYVFHANVWRNCMSFSWKAN